MADHVTPEDAALLIRSEVFSLIEQEARRRAAVNWMTHGPDMPIHPLPQGYKAACLDLAEFCRQHREGTP